MTLSDVCKTCPLDAVKLNICKKLYKIYRLQPIGAVFNDPPKQGASRSGSDFNRCAVLLCSFERNSEVQFFQLVNVQLPTHQCM